MEMSYEFLLWLENQSSIPLKRIFWYHYLTTIQFV